MDIPKSFLIILIIISCTAKHPVPDDDFLKDFIIGNYVLIGKAINSDDTYHGKVQIYKDKSNIKIKRLIDQKEIIGDAKLETTADGDATVLRINFIDNNERVNSTCLIHSDLHNYPRITCYLYYPDFKTFDPGLETFFIVHTK